MSLQWAETLRHMAAHPDAISLHCAIPARAVEDIACHIDHLTAQLAEARRERDEAIFAKEQTDRFMVESLVLCEPHGEWARSVTFADFLTAHGVRCTLCTNAERDALAAIVERVRRVAPCDHNPVADWVYYDDILDALTPTREGA